MPRYISSFPFIDLLPRNLAEDKTLAAAAEAIDPHLRKSVRVIPELLIFSRLMYAEAPELIDPMRRLGEAAGGIKALTEELLDLLAWQLHVDAYENARNYEEKRQMVLDSIMLHRRKGTPWAVKHALWVLGWESEIREGAGPLLFNGEAAFNGKYYWGNNGHRWALFDVIFPMEKHALITRNLARRMKEAIFAWKNVRSWLRALVFSVQWLDWIPLVDSRPVYKAKLVFEDYRQWGKHIFNGVHKFGPERLYRQAQAMDGSWYLDG